MNLADKKDVRAVLAAEDFSFKKSLGQNFIIDDTVCPKMAEASCNENTGVLEIGPGAGVLTAELAKRAKRVVSIELDERLKPILEKTLSGFDNTKVIFSDVMKTDLKAVLKEEFGECSEVSVCANLPYYITSPVIMLLLESHLPVTSITAMVQKEAAERLCAEVGSRKAGAVTAAVNYYAESEILFNVPRQSFLPPPNVDSCVIQLKIRKTPPVIVKDEKMFFRVVKASFAQRRKTLLNTLANTIGIDKETLRRCIEEAGLDANIRGEQLSMKQLADLSDKLAQ